MTDNGKEFSSGLLACDGAAGKRHEFDALYNHQLPQFALKDQTPMQAMKAWYDEKPARVVSPATQSIQSSGIRQL